MYLQAQTEERTGDQQPETMTNETDETNGTWDGIKNMEDGMLSGLLSTISSLKRGAKGLFTSALTVLKKAINYPGAQKNTSAQIPSDDLVILCNRQIEVCKKILMDFKNLYSVVPEFRWESNLRNTRGATKRVLVCLEISRLADDIIDAVRMVDLSGTERFFLVIIHTAEPGLKVDTSFSSRDFKIDDVAHIIYSENVGCYDCPENKKAISKLRSW
ncbi:uncharacterized protein LOC130052780 isoform X2 [Ostrea edulis]|uniref:uncharacterized protein LOC130052780 isoform X2 n=2 Tax=Ostrea edulis TaxID=37623 RepID=UPI0024AF995F|nr:uncharacterized protein LOC130052780 isoform X2 [Ostrea edulis]